MSTATGKIRIVDTTLALDTIHVHQYELLEGHLELGQQASAEVHLERRSRIRRNHTALTAILVGEENIREVIAFPKTQSGSDPLTNAPLPIDDQHLKELGLKVLPSST